MKISDRIREIRKSKGITQVWVAQKMGIPMSTYNAYELGNREIKAQLLPVIAAALDVDVAIFFANDFFEVKNEQAATAESA